MTAFPADWFRERYSSLQANRTCLVRRLSAGVFAAPSDSAAAPHGAGIVESTRPQTNASGAKCLAAPHTGSFIRLSCRNFVCLCCISNVPTFWAELQMNCTSIYGSKRSALDPFHTDRTAIVARLYAVWEYVTRGLFPVGVQLQGSLGVSRWKNLAPCSWEYSVPLTNAEFVEEADTVLEQDASSSASQALVVAKFFPMGYYNM